jgi:hypothetical protein
MKTVWIFNGYKSQFPAGVFESVDQAEIFIKRHSLSGILTEYPLGVGVFDWAIENGFFAPKTVEKSLPKFVGQFTSGAQEHFHYENGENLT